MSVTHPGKFEHRLAARWGTTVLEAATLLDQLFDEIRTETWAKGKLKLWKMGIFTVKWRRSRTVTAPGGSRHRIPQYRSVTFRADPSWRTGSHRTSG